MHGYTHTHISVELSIHLLSNPQLNARMQQTVILATSLHFLAKCFDKISKFKLQKVNKSVHVEHIYKLNR